MTCTNIVASYSSVGLVSDDDNKNW